MTKNLADFSRPALASEEHSASAEIIQGMAAAECGGHRASLATVCHQTLRCSVVYGSVTRNQPFSRRELDFERVFASECVFVTVVDYNSHSCAAVTSKKTVQKY
jgi:hypothetical protein